MYLNLIIMLVSQGDTCMSSINTVLLRIQHTLLAIILIIAVLLGCAKENTNESNDSPASIVQKSDRPKYDGPLFRLEADLTLGIDEGEPEWQIFGKWIIPEIGEGGRLYLINWPGNIVYIVSREGELLGQFGGQGSGPGEFQMPTEIFWIEDGPEVWVNDPRLARVTRFTPDGEFVDTISYSEHRREWDLLRYLGARRFLGQKLDVTSSRTENINHYGFLNEDFSWQRDFISLPGQRNVQTTERSRSPMPFSGIPRVECTPNERIVVGRPYERRLYFYDINGNIKLTIEHDWEFPKVSEEEKRDWMERMRSRPLVDPSYLAKADLPDRRPAFVTMIIDDRGRVWIRRSRSGPATEPPTYIHDVFGPNGEWLGTQSLEYNPLKFHDGCVYRLLTSQDHGPRLIRYRLSPLYPGLGY